MHLIFAANKIHYIKNVISLPQKNAYVVRRVTNMGGILLYFRIIIDKTLSSCTSAYV